MNGTEIRWGDAPGVLLQACPGQAPGTHLRPSPRAPTQGSCVLRQQSSGLPGVPGPSLALCCPSQGAAAQPGWPALLPSGASRIKVILPSRVLDRMGTEVRYCLGVTGKEGRESTQLGAEELGVTFEGGARGDPETQQLQSACPMGGQRASCPGCTSWCSEINTHADAGQQYLRCL